MRPLILTVVFLSSLTFSVPGVTASLKAVAPYPEAESGFVRHVIQLPTQADETAFQLEVLAGKELDVDCNRKRLGGELKQHTPDGGGYSYYRLDKVSGPSITMKACPNNMTRRALVPVIGKGFLLRYNSKLPVVIYTPKDVEVRYRLWSASAEVNKARVE